MSGENVFLWHHYLTIVNAKPADPSWFKQKWPEPPKNHFQINYMLEAADVRGVSSSDSKRRSQNVDPLGVIPSTTSPPPPPTHFQRRFLEQSFSLARVIEISGPRLRLRFIGTDDKNDVWLMVDSDLIRFYPSGHTLQPPFGFMRSHTVWNRLLADAKKENRIADPSWFQDSPIGPAKNQFRVGYKLEAVDRSNPDLICPATVSSIQGDNILISFDGWKGTFDYWTRYDTREIFPVGWSEKVGCELQMPGPGAHYTPPKPPPPQLTEKPISKPATTSSRKSVRSSRQKIKQTTREKKIVEEQEEEDVEVGKDLEEPRLKLSRVEERTETTRIKVQSDNPSQSINTEKKTTQEVTQPPVSPETSVIPMKSSPIVDRHTDYSDPLLVHTLSELPSLDAAVSSQQQAPISGSTAGMLNSPAVPEPSIKYVTSRAKFSDVLVQDDDSDDGN